MESVRCYLCDHEFVEGEEPWLMFEQRLREDGEIECSLADLLGMILQKDLQESVAHSTLLCDSCNADVLEYESLEKRYSQLRERILCSYKDNCTIQNLTNIIQVTPNTNDPTIENDNEFNEFKVQQDDANNLVNQEYVGVSELDLVEEVQDDDEDEGKDVAAARENVNALVNQDVHYDNESTDIPEQASSEIITDNFDFAAFNEHVAQNSLPSGVLNLSDGLVNLAVSEKSLDVQDISLEGQDIIIYDVNSKHIQKGDLISQHENNNRQDLETYNNAVDDDLNFIISADIFTSDTNRDSQQQTVIELIVSNDQQQLADLIDTSTPPAEPKPVCKQQGIIFICLLCEISPQFERQTMIEHFHTFHNSKFYMCEQCHEGYAKKQDLKIHTENGHVTKCEFCERTFTNHRLYRIHKRMHYNSAKPYECSVCQKMYVSKGVLEEHMNTHTGVRPFKCTDCPKDFASKYTLQTHMKIHKQRPRPHQCDQCGKQFLNQQNLNQHKKLHVLVKAFECDVCSKTFTTQHSLQVHKIVHSGQRPFICRICGKSFARRPEIKDHERIHTGERPYQCELCPMAFAQRSNLSSHKKSTHFNEKLHKCDQCLRSFKRRRLLDYHIQAIHTGERPHKCEICGAGFVYPEHYKKHMLIHSGKKPFACEVCGKQFNSRDNRNAHRFVHSDKKPYECMECGAGFMRKPLLLTHMKQTKHVNDTIIINQPQFTQHQPMENSLITTLTKSEVEDNEVDIDNDLQSGEESEESLEKIMFKAQELLAGHGSVSPNVKDEEAEITEDVIEPVSDHLIKDELGDVKYLQFEDLDRDGHQTLTWVDMAEDDKV